VGARRACGVDVGTAPARLRGRALWRSRPRPAEIATIGSALFLIASALSPAAAEHRAGLLLAAAAVIGYSVAWYRVLPTGTFGEWRYEFAGSFIQLIGLFTLVITGGVSSDWFGFYLLPLIATVFTYRPRVTAFVAGLAAVGILVAALAIPGTDVGDTIGVAFLRLIELAAVAMMALLVTRAMHRQRRTLLEREGELREALAVTERQALTDPLTGVHNRRSLDQALASVSSRAERDHRPYALLMVDVDHLKALNDRAGHAAGDAILRLVGRSAAEVVRAYDLVARSGGDEFVVVLHDTGDESAHRTAERIQQRFGQLVRERPELGDMTISVGAATWEPGRTTSELLTEADEGMYAAKRRRRQVS
jgi:diguanylate cyclase (GGDEF)-like protein